jgi:hypothetical protein
MPVAAYNFGVLKEVIFDDRSDQPVPNLEEDAIAPDLIREELRRIVTSRHFRTSRRGKEFLQYVVGQKISGNGDLLKERLIGVQLFGRKPAYATGEDPVVRVQAGDVRRRLESYHADPDVQSDILIQIPVGSYAPVFLLRRGVQTHETWPGIVAPSTHTETEPSGVIDALLQEVNEANASSSPESRSDTLPLLGWGDHQLETAFSHPWKRGSWGLAIAALACVALVVYLFTFYTHKSPERTLKAFWLPASLSSKPVLLCLPRPMVYRPSDKLFDRYAQSHPNAMITREARQDQILRFEPTDTIQWGDMTPVRNSGPGIGGVIAAINMSKLLTEQGIRFELRFGEEATYAEMRDSPVVLVGAINTEWTTQLTSELNFVFDETRAAPNIHETGGAKRVWKMETSDGNITRDYGLITRQLSGKAGQFLVQVAGISHFGTEAASEFLANKKEFTEALHAKSISLKEKNFQIIVSTDVTAGRAGPPHVVAVSSW